MILPGDFPPDIRVEKEVTTLSTKHQISLLCLRRGAQPERENWHGVEIYRAFSRPERWWSQWRLMTSCYSRAWQAEIEQFISDSRVDALHVHDLPLIGSTLAAVSTRKIPVIADLHENYPAMLAESQKVPLRRVNSLGSLVSRLSVSVNRWRSYEAAVVPKAQRIIVVIEEARDRLLGLGIPPDRIHVVGNYATLDKIAPRDSMLNKSDRVDKRKMRIVYAGDFGPVRDLRTVLDALTVLPEEIRSQIDIQLIGGQGRDLMQLREHAKALGIADRVELMQWLPRPEAEQLMTEADVGLVPHEKSEHTDSTVPHKLFQYMWRRLPVIVSNCRPLQRIVQETGCGLIYKSGDPQSLADCLGEMYARADRMTTMGAAGHSAVRDKYNWDVAGEVLLYVYDELSSR
jgi:glycosyltransferase involved in cell wall biosynthesis